MVVVAQLVRALDCGSEGRGFESRLSPFPFYQCPSKAARFARRRVYDEQPVDVDVRLTWTSG